MFLLPEKSGAVVLAIWIVLWVIPRIEGWINKLRSPQIYEVVCSVDEEKMEQIEKLFLESGLQVSKGKRTQSGGHIISRWKTHGRPETHKRLVIMLFAHPHVKGFQMPAACLPTSEGTTRTECAQLSAPQCLVERIPAESS